MTHRMGSYIFELLFFQCDTNKSLSSFLEPFAKFDGHVHMITEISSHPLAAEVTSSHLKEHSLLDDLVLTSSLDWSVRLWRPQDFSKKTLSKRVITPLITLELWGGCIHDVKWSPTNPCVFAVAGPNAQISIFDLSLKTELPVLTLSLGEELVRDGPISLTSISWLRSGDGILTSLSNGSVVLHSIGKEVSVYSLFHYSCSANSRQLSIPKPNACSELYDSLKRKAVYLSE